MSTIKKFIKYYAPYKGVFFFDLFCAAVISIVDLMYPQILRTSDKHAVLQGTRALLSAR